jgi:hypothetical protein
MDGTEMLHWTAEPLTGARRRVRRIARAAGAARETKRNADRRRSQVQVQPGLSGCEHLLTRPVPGTGANDDDRRHEDGGIGEGGAVAHAATACASVSSDIATPASAAMATIWAQ